jgi:hypothetical protein
MKKANLFCPREVVFVDGRMTYSPTVPGLNTPLSGSMLEIEVNILEVEGDQAIVLLPEILRYDQEETATVGVHHLN